MSKGKLEELLLNAILQKQSGSLEVLYEHSLHLFLVY